MKFTPRLVLLIMAGLFSSYSPAQPAAPGGTAEGGQALIDRLHALLPGTYSNFAQANRDGVQGPVTDLTIRQLPGGDAAAYLFESQVRGTGPASYDIYWLKLNPQTRQAELHFSHLTGSELSLSLKDTLAIAWRRVLPGCTIVLEADQQRFYGHTEPDRCRFEDPLRGATRLYRSLSLGAHSLETETIALLPGEQADAGAHSLIMQKHRLYRGQVSERANSDADTGEYGEWKSSTLFNIRDDGRVVQIYDGNMKTMQYGVQLARLPWRAGEPPYLRLAVINLQNGATQAFSWFKPGPEPIVMNQEWFKANLTLYNGDNVNTGSVNTGTDDTGSDDTGNDNGDNDGNGG